MSTPRSQSSKRLEQFIARPQRAIWTMALPMMGGMAVHTLYVVADTAFIGTLGTESLAAITFVGPLFFVLVALTLGLGTAVTALVAQALGRRDERAGDQVAGTAMSAGLVLGVGLALAGLATGRTMLGALGADDSTIELGWQYFQIIALIVPLFFVSTVFRSVLTGEGDARTPMLVLTASTVLNIGLDALFILSLEWGLRGAALATAAAQTFALSIFATLLLRRRNAFIRFRLHALKGSAQALRQLTALAAPAAAGMAVMSIGGMLFNRLLAEFGQVAVAAYGAASKIDMIVAMPIFGLAGAAVSVVGMFAGAGRADLVRKAATYTYRWALLLSFFIGAAAYLGSGMILRVFTRDTTAISIGSTYLAFMVFAYPMMAVGITTGRLLQGIGHGLPPLFITSVRVLVIGVPVAYGAVYLFNAPIEAVWVGVLLGGFAATLLSIAWVYHLFWRKDPTARATAAVDEHDAPTNGPPTVEPPLAVTR